LKHTTLVALLQKIYPQHQDKWLPWLFDRVPAGYWDDIEHIKHYLRWLGKHLWIQDPSEWKDKLTDNTLRLMRGRSLMNHKKVIDLVKIAEIIPLVGSKEKQNVRIQSKARQRESREG